ncbi:MAG: hypothetical protein ACFFB3_17520, partial [Candidatus Hodarchaeota archaeon]
ASSYVDGVEYSYSIALNPGSHSYHFEAADDSGSARLPSDGEFTGPEVSSLYLTTYLTNSTLNQMLGDTNTVFDFRIVYCSLENTAPDFVRINLNGSSHIMTQVEPTATNYIAGIEFKFQTNLPVGNHSYTFVASNGTFTILYPPTGTFPGPNVVASLTPPTLASASVSPESGEICQDFTFSVKYISENNFPPAYVRVVLGEIPYSLTQSNQSDNLYSDGAEFFVNIQICNEGIHSFYFEASDGYFIAQRFTSSSNDSLKFSVSSPSSKTSETNGNAAPSDGQNAIGFTGKIVIFGLAIALVNRWRPRGQKYH